MTIHLVIVVALAAAAAIAADPVSRHLAPKTAARLLTAAAVLSFVLLLWVLAVVSIGGLGAAPWLSERMGWCPPVSSLTHQVPLPVAVSTTLTFVIVIGRAARRWRIWRLIRVDQPRDAFAILPVDEPLAYALPGRPGGIVASRGMLALLDGPERRALLAHEQAHLDHGHHRYLRAAELAASIPLLRPVSRSVRFCTERWADEEAARAVGDRRVVARALSRAALANPSPSPFGVGGLVGDGMVERVSGLLGEPPGSLDLAQASVLTSSIVSLVGVTALTFRMHDVLAVVAHVCGVG